MVVPDCSPFTHTVGGINTSEHGSQNQHVPVSAKLFVYVKSGQVKSVKSLSKPAALNKTNKWKQRVRVWEQEKEQVKENRSNR